MDAPDPTIWGQCFFSPSDGQYVATLACVPYLIKNIVDVAIALAGAVAVFFIVWGGIQYIRSGGDPKQAEGARHTITYAIIGLIVVLMAYFILTVVAQLTGADCIRMLGFTNCKTSTEGTSFSYESAVDTPQDGDIGCFYGKQKRGELTISTDRSCYLKDAGNDPVEATQWFRGETASRDCQSYCSRLPEF